MELTISIPQRLRERAEQHPDRPFAIEAAAPGEVDRGGRSVTYGQFQHEALRWAGVYRGLGLG
ncbi:MAG TPA: hypothetical protein PLV68_12460, partial [Ilumatobacteraceae bacterium]|nr:hypothetical protein [Ilumatobacteraceae bacterium]